MDSLAAWISVLVNASVAVAFMLHYRRRVTRAPLDHGVARTSYSWASFASGFPLALLVFFALLILLDVP